MGTRDELGGTLFWLPWYQGARLRADLGRVADRVTPGSPGGGQNLGSGPTALLCGAGLLPARKQAFHMRPAIALWWSHLSTLAGLEGASSAYNFLADLADALGIWVWGPI